MSQLILCSVAALFFLLGIIVQYASAYIVCVQFFQCFWAEGKDGLILKAYVKALQPQPGIDKVIEQLPFLLYVIGGAFLIAGLVKSVRN